LFVFGGRRVKDKDSVEAHFKTANHLSLCASGVRLMLGKEINSRKGAKTQRKNKAELKRALNRSGNNGQLTTNN
jgi:hypothetical protein